MRRTVSEQLFLIPVGRQVSQRLAEQARKRELFEEMKQQLEHQQEVRQVIMFVSVARDSLTDYIFVPLNRDLKKNTG